MEFRNPEEHIDRFRSRLTVAGGFVLACFALLFGRFVWLQVVQHSYYQTRAEDNRISLVPLGLLLAALIWMARVRRASAATLPA